MKRRNYGFWILLAVALANILEPRVLAMLVPVFVALAALRLAGAAARRRKTNDDEQEPAHTVLPHKPQPAGKSPHADARWRGERQARRREFDEQRARQSGSSGSMLTETDSEAFAHRAQELKDLLNAGIIEQPEYNERMAALRDEWGG